MKLKSVIFFVGLWMMLCASTAHAKPDDSLYIDLTLAGVCNFVTDKQQLLRTQSVLLEEVAKRSHIDLPGLSAGEIGEKPSILLALESDLSQLPETVRQAVATVEGIGAEGYQLLSLKALRAVVIIGKDSRGLLYGVGKFLRKATLTPNSILFPEALMLATTPQYPMRGHQLGFRPKTNSYDAFTVGQFDQYIRDLALFGANTIELLPPNTDDAPTSVNMKLSSARMVVEQARICASYGLGVSMWYPNIGEDYESPLAIEAELAEREEVFSSLPRLDALFVPAGDPGDLEVDVLFKWIDRMSEMVRKYHPTAKIWISPQAFKPTPAWFDSFFEHANKKYDWFGGVVFGPWVRLPIEEIRSRLAPEIPIRRYPDITHNFSCQYPIPDLDLAWALTLGRESINPRPYEFKYIHNLFDEYAVGSVSYSEGTNDDVNKFVWSDQDWDPSTPVVETLRDYARLFLDPLQVEPFVRAIIGLEENLKGSPAVNEGILRTLEQWRYLEAYSPVGKATNPRFQMGLIRAYFDAYTYRRWLVETAQEQEAIALLLREPSVQPLDHTIRNAMAVLRGGGRGPVALEWKQRCLELADSLYKSIGAQLTVERHHGQEERGNFIDHIDMPLNDAPWLLASLEGILTIADSVDRKNAIAQLLNRAAVGPGGRYDLFSETSSWKKVEKGQEWLTDPGNLRSASYGFNIKVKGPSQREAEPKAWMKQATVLYDQPLIIDYADLDTSASYWVKVAYTGRFKSHVRLYADDLLVHDYQLVSGKDVLAFPVPEAAIADGEIAFKWTCKAGERGLQVAELWLEIDK